MLQQIDYNIHATHKGSHMQWSQTTLSGGTNTGAVTQQQFDNLNTILFTGNVQRGKSIQGSGIGVRVAIDPIRA